MINKAGWLRPVLTVVLLVMVSFTIGGKGCPWSKDKDDDDIIVGSSAPVEEFPLGLKLLSNELYESIPTVAAPLMGIEDLPAECDIISSNMPTAGNQYPQNSCVGWAVAYALKTHQERVERSWSLDTSNHLFSPAYIYNQINLGRYSGTDSGAWFVDALNILTSQGCATLATMSYNASNYLTQPSQTARDEAAQYKVVFCGKVERTDRTEIKKWLKSGSALPIGILLGTNFSKTNIKNNNYIYKSLGNKIRDMNGNLSYPGHAVTLVGYSDTKFAFKFINSWGTGWGDNGYAWIDYDFFPQVCQEAYYVRDEVSTETVSTPNQPTGPTSGNTGVSYSYSTGGSTSSLGHSVRYAFDWGDGSSSGWLPLGTTSASHSWSSAGTYNVKALAACYTDEVVSQFSSVFEVIISDVPPSETVSTPNQPTGATSGYTSTSYDYSTGGASSSLGHSVQYRFYWGDGAYSNWSSTSKTWFSAGTYTVKAQARCATDTSVVSDWSSGISVSITLASSWQISSMDSSGDTGLHTDIAIDSNNKIRISYYDNTNTGLMCWMEGTGYSTLDSVGLVGLWTSIAIDSNNKVHISYYDDTNNSLKYATNASGVWVYTTVDDDATLRMGKRTSIALDSNNKVHIAYQCYTDSSLKYATNASGSWVKTTVDNSGDIKGEDDAPSIAIDSNNKVHISYAAQSSPLYTQKYATNKSGSWVVTTLDPTSGPEGYSSIAIDSNNKVHISYLVCNELKYATNASGSWVYTTVDPNSSIYQRTSIAVDSNNKIHISYHYNTNGDLKYATNASGSWVLTTVDSTGDVGEWSSIVLDSNNKVHISYYDTTNGDLKYATNK